MSHPLYRRAVHIARITIVSLLVILGIGQLTVQASSLWQRYSMRGVTHFAQVWRSNQWCGQPVGKEHRSRGGWAQRFQRCTMTEGRVRVIKHAITTSAASRGPAASGCPGGDSQCAQALVQLLNQDRAQQGIGPLALDPTQSAGTNSCAGSAGHSRAMAKSGTIWHQNTGFPQASFPRNICVTHSIAGQNVGEASVPEWAAIQTLNRMMMNEPHSPSICASQDDHACNILNSHFRRVGIGLVESSHTLWLTEDFIG